MVSDPTMRKMVTFRDEIYEEMGKKFESPIRRVTVAVVLKNPYAGRYVEDLSPLLPFAHKLGSQMGKIIVDEFGGEKNVESFGKAGIVGEDGELEHIEFILHGGIAGGYREHVGDFKKAPEFITSMDIRGPMGTPLDIPLRCKLEYRVNYIDTVRICIPDAPRRDEMVIALTGGNGPRPNGRTPSGY